MDFAKQLIYLLVEMIRYYLVLVFLLSSPIIKAQLQTSKWATIGGDLIDAAVHPPKIIGKNIGGQGWTTISDLHGKLLFYTNGSLFYNQKNELIGNSGLEKVWADELLIAFQKFGNHNNYLNIFISFEENDPLNDRFLYYNTVDLTKKSDVATKSKKITVLPSPSYTDINATRSTTCQSFWLMVAAGNSIKSYLIDNNEINLTPVNSNLFGSPYCIGTGAHCFKISPDGTTVAIITRGDVDTTYSAFLEILNFNNENGRVTPRTRLPLPITDFYSYTLEFSPNSNNLFLLLDSLYIDENFHGFSNKKLWVFKPKSKTLDELNTTSLLLDSAMNVPHTFSSIQLAPTGKVYLTFDGNNNSISVINKPNAISIDDFNFQRDILSNLNYAILPSFPSFHFQNINNDIMVLDADAGSDKTACRNENLLLGAIPKDKYEYRWNSPGNLDEDNISNPILFAPENTSMVHDTTTHYLMVSDSLCRQGLDSVKVIYKPSLPGTIAGSKSVCPGVKEVSYWVEGVENDNYDWEVLGGSIAGKFLDSITVDWTQENFLANVNVTSINAYGCEDVIKPLPVKIFKQLDTEKPNGIDTLLCEDRLYDYNILPTNGSVYIWHIINGNIETGDGTNQVSVLWDKNEKYGGLWIEESVNTELEICFGRSDTLHVVNPTAFSDENISLYTVSAVLDNTQQLKIYYELKNSIFFNDEIEIFWRPKSVSEWQDPFIGLSKDKSQIFDFDDIINEEILFQLRTYNVCEAEILSTVNSNIYLNLQQDLENERILLDWNSPVGWHNVQSHSVYSKIDDRTYNRIDSLLGDQTSLEIVETTNGFLHRFYIVGHATDSQFPSFSNVKETFFEHIPFIPNVITPNGDGFNDQFKIRKIELYPENYLVIFNRYGKKVFETRNYQNNWDASGLPSGVYFYQYKTHLFSRVLNGYIHVLKN